MKNNRKKITNLSVNQGLVPELEHLHISITKAKNLNRPELIPGKHAETNPK